MTKRSASLRALLLPCSLVVAQPSSVYAQSDSAVPTTSDHVRDGQHDFDFEFGAWTIRLSRLDRPLTGSNSWVDYEGTSVVRRVWDGRANLGELDVEGSTGRIQGLSLRLYNPESREWHISWASSRDGLLGPPMVGGFEDGRGEFYGHESFNGRAIYVRFIFSDITPSTFRFEQAFSDDGGKTWEPNWVATFAKVSDESDGAGGHFSSMGPSILRSATNDSVRARLGWLGCRLGGRVFMLDRALHVALEE